MDEIIDKNDELTEEQFDLVRGGMPIEAIAEFAHNNDMSGVLTSSQAQGLEEIYNKSHDIVTQKRVRDVVFMMHANASQTPVIDVMYITEDGEKYIPMKGYGNDPREIFEEASYIARKFEPKTDETIETVIYDPKTERLEEEFKGPHFVNGEGTVESHYDYIAGYRLVDANDMDNSSQVQTMYEQLEKCMIYSNNLSNHYNFNFFVNDKALVNPYTISDFSEQMVVTNRNMDIVEGEFGIVFTQDDSKHI